MFWLALVFTLAILPWAFPVLWQVRPVQAVASILLLGTVLGPPFFALDGPIQLSLDRIVWLGLMTAMVLRMLRGGERIDSLDRFDVILVGFVGWALLSCVRFGLTTPPHPPISRWLFMLAMPCTLYFCMRLRQGSDDQSLRKIVDTLSTAVIILSTYLALTAILEVINVRALVFPKFINDAKIWEFYGRGRGPLLNPAGNGIVMSIGLAACLARCFASARAGQLFYGVLALIALMGCYSTLTRSVWMGAAVTIGSIGLLYAPLKLRIIAVVGIVLVGGLAVSGLKDSILEIKRDKNLSAADAAKSVELRPLLAVVAWEMFKDRPLAGHGYGQYTVAAEPYHTVRTHGLPLESVRPYIQHNVFLSTAVDLGLIGLTMQVLLLGSLGCIVWQLCCRHATGSPQRTLGMTMLGMLSSYLVNGMFHDVAIISMVNMYLLGLAGLTITVARCSRQHQPVGLSHERRASEPGWATA
ncbi:O-antigen ligase family protein [Neorhodopirellula pilleata]|uniref:O-Antigen ligase n=1 Tax=Neorhodopirellula pilleata TaxID=2714738 RepID=A0A5C6ABD5_9BACT|nr:O-antigen ligase family protein [Neorhodopirellula pilleata]TWT95643.1 O-Antigen ligase [Neorhodopirellula pilleata]